MSIEEILLIATAVVTIASVLVKLTPNTWDDKIVSKLLQFLSLQKNVKK